MIEYKRLVCETDFKADVSHRHFVTMGEIDRLLSLEGQA